MNRRGDMHGHFGVRMKKGCKSRPYYGRVSFRGEYFDTRPYATRDQAAVATQILDAALRLVAEMPSALSPAESKTP